MHTSRAYHLRDTKDFPPLRQCNRFLFFTCRLDLKPQFFYFWSTDYTDSTDFARALLVPIRMAARAQPLAYLFNPCYLLTKKIREICGLD